MKRIDAEIIDYYNNAVVSMICGKYNAKPLDAYKSFALSATHEMLESYDCQMTDFGAGAIFDMWECEKISGNPRNSIYIRGD